MPRNINKILNLLVLFCALAVLCTALLINDNTTFSPPDTARPFSDGWSIVNPDGTSSPAQLPLSFGDGPIVITKTLPHVPEDAVLLVKCNYKTMKAEVNGELIYESGLATLGNISTDTGHYVALIPLRHEHSDQEIRLTVEERESGHNTQLKYIDLTTVSTYGFGLLISKYVYMILALVLFLAGLVSLAVWFPFKRGLHEKTSSLTNGLLWIGAFAISLGTWILTEPHFVGIVRGRFAASGMLNYISLMALPLCLAGLLRRLLLRKKFLITEALLIILELAFCVEVVLFLFFGTDLSAMLRVYHFSILLALAIFCAFIIFNRKEVRFSTPVKISITLAMVFCATAIITYALGGDYMLWAIIAVVIFLVSMLSHVLIELVRALDEARTNLRYKDFALTDALTGLGSRLAYSELCERYADSFPADLTLIYLDTNRLKDSNDRFGHDAGDQLIIGTANCIREAFGEQGEYFRMGGDEFLAVLSSDNYELQRSLAAIKRLTGSWKGSYGVPLSVSYGVVSAREFPDLSFEELVKEADTRMYGYKQQVEGNRV